MPKVAITRRTILAVVGVTTLSAVACGSADTKAGGSSLYRARRPPWHPRPRRRSTGRTRWSDRCIGVRQQDRGERSGGAARCSSRLDEDHGVDPAKPTDITPGLCHSSGREGAEGAAVTADAVVVGASKRRSVPEDWRADNAGGRAVRWRLPRHRGPIDDKTMLVSTHGTDGSSIEDDGRVQRPDSLRRSALG